VAFGHARVLSGRFQTSEYALASPGMEVYLQIRCPVMPKPLPSWIREFWAQCFSYASVLYVLLWLLMPRVSPVLRLC
jgi:hypothetical protein